MKSAFLVAATILLAACTTLPSEEKQQRSEVLWRAHSLSLDEFVDWRVNARIAVTTADDGGNVRMIWRQQANDFDVRFSAAFGQGATRLTQADRVATLVDANGDTYRGSNAEYLLYERLGWRVPIAQLREWLIGRPGDTEDYTLRPDGMLESARLDGWTVRFQSYQTDNRPVLPARLILFRDDIRVRVVVDGWSHLGKTIQSKRIAIPDGTASGD